MLIGLTGEARCGKDTVATMLGLPEYHFSKPMKDACRVIFGWGDEHLYGDLKEVVDPKFNVSPRKALQTMGTDWGRNMIVQDIWLKRAQIEINSNEHLVVSDVRFDNEARLIRSNGGIIVKIIRGDKPSVRDHVSEEGISEQFVDRTIYNDGTINQLKNMVTSLKVGMI